jgi:hypothetical protein
MTKQSLFVVRTVWNTQIQCVPHRKHFTSPLQSPTGLCCEGKQSLFTVRTVRTAHTDRLCGQSVPHRQHISATEPNRLMLCGETVAVCCQNCTEHTDTLWAVRTSQETHHVTATEPNRLMLCGETVAVCCQNRPEPIYTMCGQNAEF